MLFRSGQVVATPAALVALEKAEQAAGKFLTRHFEGDWGDLCEEDKQENQYSLSHHLRLMSAYTLKTGQKLWIITEADRSVTTLLLPSDY